jgi:hypothetical protein
LKIETLCIEYCIIYLRIVLNVKCILKRKQQAAINNAALHKEVSNVSNVFASTPGGLDKQKKKQSLGKRHNSRTIHAGSGLQQYKRNKLKKIIII